MRPAEASESLPFLVVCETPVRFRDLDAMGHVHHSLALVYIEEARAIWWRDVVGRPSIDYVIGEVTVRFHQRILYPDTLAVGLRVRAIGNASFRLEYEIRNRNGELLVSAETAQIMYDYEVGGSRPIPEQVRARLAAVS